MQTAKDPIPPYVLKINMAKTVGWNYVFFNDDGILKFFEENPIAECPDIKRVFQSFSSGPHKADLFRYYFLYIKGGVFLDSDAVLKKSLDSIVQSYKGVFVRASPSTPGAFFNGFIAITPQHSILKEALMKLYSTTDDMLRADYYLVTRQLYEIMSRHSNDSSLKMLTERDVRHSDDAAQCETEDPVTKEIVFIHYPVGEVPKE